jgi:hypothetical protein
MKPHPKIRKTIKWGGAAVTVLLAVVWIGSFWARVTYVHSSRLSAWVSSGALGAVISKPGPLDFLHHGDGVSPFLDGERAEWSVGRRSANPVAVWPWRAKTSGPDFSDGIYVLPLWIPCAICLCITAVCWRRDLLARRRARLNLCPNCDYDRAGLASGAPCPECGAAPPVPAS